MAGLADKVVVVTGGASGMGREHALGFARQGAHIVIGDRADATKTARAVEALGVRALALPLDVSDEQSVQRFAAEAVARFEHVDILINNAGIYPFESFDAMSVSSWRRVMAVNLDGPFLMCKALVPAMKRRGWGRVVNIASAEAWMAASDNLHYIASKMGVVGLTRALATEVAAHGITVNAIAPGIVAGTSIDKTAPHYLESLPQAFQAIKRPARPIDIVNAAMLFASEEAAFITGQTLVVDGGGVRL